jgi:hypothetical protein
MVSLPIPSLVLNVQNSMYTSTLPNVACRKPNFPHVCIPFIGNVIEQNPVGFPNSMYHHVGPYTPYFGSDYRGIKSVLTMWPPMFDPLVKPIT